MMMLEIAADLGFSEPEPPVVLYEHCSGGGYAVSLGVGSYTMGDLQALGVANDDISSIDVASGYTLTMYRDYNFTGGSISKTGNDACLVDDGFNDDVSSVVVSQSGSRVGSAVDVEETQVVSVYPNPVTQGSNIQISGVETVQAIDLLNLNGQVVRQLDLTENSFSTNGLVKGIYMIRMTTDSEVKLQKLLVR